MLHSHIRSLEAFRTEFAEKGLRSCVASFHMFLDGELSHGRIADPTPEHGTTSVNELLIEFIESYSTAVWVDWFG